MNLWDLLKRYDVFVRYHCCLHHDQIVKYGGLCCNWAFLPSSLPSLSITSLNVIECFLDYFYDPWPTLVTYNRLGYYLFHAAHDEVVDCIFYWASLSRGKYCSFSLCICLNVFHFVFFCYYLCLLFSFAFHFPIFWGHSLFFYIWSSYVFLFAIIMLSLPITSWNVIESSSIGSSMSLHLWWGIGDK